MDLNLSIRESTHADLKVLLEVERRAFDSEEEAALVRDLLVDPSAEPRLSLLAYVDGKPAGHIIFSKAVFDPVVDIVGSILGPLAVVPAYQKMGVGAQLIDRGLEILKVRGVDLVFVLGHESYYPRFGFTPAIEQGFEPPYPIPAKFANAWMAQSLVPSTTAAYKGMVIPADTFKHPQYWGE